MLEIVPVEQIPKLEDIKDVPVKTDKDLLDVYKVCLQLEELCDKHEGIGIAAVQAGIPWKLFLIKSDGTNLFVPKDKYAYFVNCTYELTTNSKTVVSLEGCLSLRSLGQLPCSKEELLNGRLRHFQVERHSEIMLSGQRLILKDSKILIENVYVEIGLGEQGVVFQHEVDHCFAILISDKGKEVVLWQNGGT